MTKFKFFNGSIYIDPADFGTKCQYRRLTFGYSMYARKRISLRSRLRLIWLSFFTRLGGEMRVDYYVKKYLERETKRGKRYTLAQIVIDYDDPNFTNVVASIVMEKALLDKTASETGQKFIN